jgi:hypothetical protein
MSTANKRRISIQKDKLGGLNLHINDFQFSARVIRVVIITFSNRA